MKITQQAFADAVIAHVAENPATLDLGHQKAGVSDHWTYYAEGMAMSGSLCLVHHGMFDRVYKRDIILPRAWDRFCEQFLSPEARLLMQLYHECQRPSWLTWDPEETDRDDSPMTRHFWTQRHQDRTYTALLCQLKDRDHATEPTRIHADDIGAIGIKLPDRVANFPGSYRTLESVVYALQSDRYLSDIPHNIRRYGDSKPVLHMIGDVVDSGDDELCALIANKSNSSPKEQQVVYVLSESRSGELIARRVGRMRVSVLEIAYGSVAGAIHSDMDYLVPNDLSPDERKSYDTSTCNWEIHCTNIIEKHPLIAEILGIAT